ELTSSRLESLHILARHLRSPISQAGSNRPSSRGPSLTLVKPEHGFVVWQTKEGAERRAFLGGISDQGFIAELVVQLRPEGMPGLPPGPHVPFPPQRCRRSRVLL